MGHPLTLEPMTSADLLEVMEIERLAFESPWSQGLFLRELKLPFAQLMVARTVNGRSGLAGYVCWWTVGDEVHIHNLAVHPDHRRAGVGRFLVEHVLEDAARRAVQSISLEVRHDNESARALYHGFGFSERGVRKHYYGRGEDAIIMTKDLAPTVGSAGTTG
jgi:ribosomal-protein-alanine N-acetyltransferase